MSMIKGNISKKRSRKMARGSSGFPFGKPNANFRSGSRPGPLPISSQKELKGCDVPLTVTLGNVLATVTTNGAAVLVNPVQSGTGSWNRIGRKIFMKSIRVRVHAACRHFISVGADLSGSSLRIVLVYDKQPNSTTLPTFDTIFGQTDGTGTETGAVFDSLRFDNTLRFKVLMDKVITSTPKAIVGTTAADYVDNYHWCDEFVKLKGLETLFSSTSNPITNADISTGSLYVYFRSNLNAGTSAQWLIEATSLARLRFYD